MDIRHLLLKKYPIPSHFIFPTAIKQTSQIYTLKNCHKVSLAFPGALILYVYTLSFYSSLLATVKLYILIFISL